MNKITEKMQTVIHYLPVLLMFVMGICGTQVNIRKLIRNNLQHRTWRRHNRQFLVPPLLERLPQRLRHRAQPFHTRPRSMTSPDHIPPWVSRKYNNVRPKAYGMCNTDNSLEKLLPEIKRMFPGQFMSQNDVAKQDEVKREHRNRMRTNRNNWVFEPALSIEDTSELIEAKNTTNNAMAFTRSQETRNQRVSNEAQNINRNAVRCEPTCCATRKFHVVYNNVTIDSVDYPVVNLSTEKQFISVGFCPETNVCPTGKCHQHYGKQYIVIWNVTVDHWPPVDLTPYDFPSHCSWISN